VLAPGIGGETPPELASEDAYATAQCGVRAKKREISPQRVEDASDCEPKPTREINPSRAPVRPPEIEPMKAA
jgi:hypothetical protein